MAIGSKELAPVELDTFEDERLVDELKKAKEELFNLRFQSATGQLESHGRIRAVKRDIARIYTVIRERELGLRATPVVVEAPAKAAKKAAAPKTAKSEKDTKSEKVAVKADDVADAATGAATETKEA
jgi:large subunit ribosomal protein L29